MSKGSRNRTSDHERFRENWDGIRWKPFGKDFTVDNMKKLLPGIFDVKEEDEHGNRSDTSRST